MYKYSDTVKYCRDAAEGKFCLLREKSASLAKIETVHFCFHADRVLLQEKGQGRGVSDKVVLPAWQIEWANTNTHYICNYAREPDEESSQQELVTVCMSLHNESQQQASVNECLGGPAQSVHLAEEFTCSKKLVFTVCIPFWLRMYLL